MENTIANVSLRDLILLQSLAQDTATGPKVVFNFSPLQLLALSASGGILGYSLPTILKYLELNRALVGNSSRALRLARLYRSLAVPGALVGAIVTPILALKLARGMLERTRVTPEERLALMLYLQQKQIEKQLGITPDSKKLPGGTF